MPRMPISRREAEERLKRVNAVLTPNERTLMEEVCGKGVMLESVAPQLGLSYEEALKVLRTALDKTALVQDASQGTA